jgi:DNA-binding NarL/FixJ family response regulator
MRKPRMTVLCIEDDRETASLIAEKLVEWGFDPILAHGAAEGFAEIIKYRPDLVLCDITMPRMSGFEVLERLNEIAPQFGHIPFVFLVTIADRENELRGRRLSADDYVIKPIDFDVLHTIIKARLARVARKEIWPKLTVLSNREIETLTWVARGKTSVEIAKIIGLAKRTVDFHLDGARVKLGATTRTEAALKAAIGRLIQP